MPIFGMGLHHAHEADDRRSGHDAVGVERQHQLELAAPFVAEVADVTGLVAGVVGAAAVGDAVAVGILRLPGGDGLGFLVAERIVVGVRQHEIAEGRALARGIDAGLDGPQAADGALGIFVAHRHEDGGLDGQRHVGVAGRRIRRDLGHRRGVKVQQPQADDRIPEAEHGPGRADREADPHDDVDDRPATGPQDGRRRPQHQEIGDDVQRQDDQAALAQLGRGLQARGRRPTGSRQSVCGHGR